MHAPIANSIINPKARLYKRFTPTERFVLDGSTIEIENHYYRCHFLFSWVNSEDMQLDEERPIDGLIGHSNRMNIKLHGNWKEQPGSPTEPEPDDVVGIGDEYWVIEDGIQRKRLKSMVNLAVITLPLRRLM